MDVRMAVVLLIVVVGAVAVIGGFLQPQAGPNCGNGVLDQGEECDGGQGCQGQQVCTARCRCESMSPPKLPE